MHGHTFHRNLELTSETQVNGSMPFLDMKLELKQGKMATFWYQKPTDTGLILQFRALAPMVYKKDIIEGTVYWVFNSTSISEKFAEGDDSAMKIWESNRCRPQFHQSLMKATLDKILNGKAKPLSEQSKPTNTMKTMLILQYRGNKSDQFSKKLWRTDNVSVIFTTRRMKSALPSLEAPVPKLLLRNVVYQITCPGCQSS